MGLLKSGNYTHYGNPVRFRRTENFRLFLKNEGIEYVDLPIMAKHGFEKVSVISYNYKNQKRYAVLSSWEYGSYEDCFIIDCIPDDCDFGRLIDDVLGQADGRPPMEMRTKASMLLKLACDNAEKKLMEIEIKNNTLFENMIYGRENDDEFYTTVRYELIYLGYSIETLEKMDHHDVNESFFNNVKNSKL